MNNSFNKMAKTTMAGYPFFLLYFFGSVATVVASVCADLVAFVVAAGVGLSI